MPERADNDAMHTTEEETQVTDTAAQVPDLMQRLTTWVDGVLTAAWAQYGPGDWPPGSFMPLGEWGTTEVEVLPYWAWTGNTGIYGWSNIGGGDSRPAWCWRINVGYDDLEKLDAERIEDVCGCVDSRDVSFFVEGPRDVKPLVPDGFVEALCIVIEG